MPITNVSRKSDMKRATIGIEIRLPRVLYEVVCDNRKFFGYTPQKTIKAVLIEYFKEELMRRQRGEPLPKLKNE